MFHIKVWLGVILMGIVTLQLWWMQPNLTRRVSEEHERLRPLLASQRFEHSMRNFYDELKRRTKAVADDKALRKAASQINYDAEDALTKTMNYESVNKLFFRNFRIPHKINAQTELYYVISRDGQLLYRSTNPSVYEHDKDRLNYAIGHVDDAFQGRVRTGIWMIEGHSSVVAAAPIYHNNPKKGVMATLMYARRFGADLLEAINSDLPKDSKLILFTANKPEKGEIKLAPITYNIVDPKLTGLFRGWFMSTAYDAILDKYQGGMDNDRLLGTVQEKDYNYMIGHFPAELSLGQIGYVLMIPRPLQFFQIDRKNYYQSGGPLIVSLVCLIFAFILATWLSGAEITYFRRVLPRLQTAPQDEFPNIPERGLSRPWRALVASINRIFTMIRERGLGNSDLEHKSSLLAASGELNNMGAEAMGLLAENLTGDEVLHTSFGGAETEERAAALFGLQQDTPSYQPYNTPAQQHQPYPNQANYGQQGYGHPTQYQGHTSEGQYQDYNNQASQQPYYPNPEQEPQQGYYPHHGANPVQPNYPHGYPNQGSNYPPKK